MDLKEYNNHSYEYNKRHPWEQARLRIVKYVIDRLEKKNILDIGSGDAFISASLATQYPNSSIYGVDINYNQDQINMIMPHIPNNLLLFDNLIKVKQHLKSNVDIVLLMDVLEHIEFPETLLKELCLSNINEKTTFFITVPAYQFLYSEHDRKLGHIKRYNLEELSFLMQSNGFKIMQKGYTFSSLFVIRSIQKLFEKIKKNDLSTKTSIQDWKRSNFLTSILTFAFWFEFKISWYLSKLGINIPGLSCYCVCHYSPL